MINFCRNCGTKLEKNVKICPNCNVEVFERRIIVEEKEKELKEFKKKEKTYVIVISLLSLVILLSYLNNFKNLTFVMIMRPLFLITTIVMIVYARITLNKSKIIRIMFIIIIILLIIYIIFLLINFFAVARTINQSCHGCVYNV